MVERSQAKACATKGLEMDASADDEHFAGDVVGEGRAEEQNGARGFVDGPAAAEGTLRD